MRHTFKEKRAWVLQQLREQYEVSCRCHNPPQRPRICAMDEHTQQAWAKEFSGKVVVYTIGPSVSPGLARTLRRMFEDGDLLRVTGGNQEARHYCQKTYYVAYTPRRWPPQNDTFI